MRKVCFIGLLLYGAFIWASDNTIAIPLQISYMSYMPQDSPTGSTPDPTDPNQFRASLTGNILHIETQKESVSYVVVQETQSDRQGEDYFYSLCYGTVDCTITHPGIYTIYIGYWKTDFIGKITVYSMDKYAFNGQGIQLGKRSYNERPGDCFFIQLRTSLGITTAKICQLP